MHSGSLLSCNLLGDELCDCRRSIAGRDSVDSKLRTRYDIAAADNGNGLAYCGLLEEVDLAQEVDAGEHAGHIVAGAADLGALGCADSKVECLEALLAQLVERNVLADLNAGLELYAHVLYQ